MIVTDKMTTERYLAAFYNLLPEKGERRSFIAGPEIAASKSPVQLEIRLAAKIVKLVASG